MDALLAGQTVSGLQRPNGCATRRPAIQAWTPRLHAWRAWNPLGCRPDWLARKLADFRGQMDALLEDWRSRPGFFEAACLAGLESSAAGLAGWLARKLVYQRVQTQALLEDKCYRPGVLEAAGMVGCQGYQVEEVQTSNTCWPES